VRRQKAEKKWKKNKKLFILYFLHHRTIGILIIQQGIRNLREGNVECVGFGLG
jgi:hypothetical protein